ncbi:MAG: NusG domain II-containing protein, partial [Candidatus Aminicenantales bacterium]
HLAGDASGTGIRVYREGRLLETLRLQEDREKSYRVRGGVIVLRIQLSQARIISASCRHQVCVSTAPISWSGERILCAPNHFMIAALGSSPVDTVIG